MSLLDKVFGLRTSVSAEFVGLKFSTRRGLIWIKRSEYERVKSEVAGAMLSLFDDQSDVEKIATKNGGQLDVWVSAQDLAKKIKEEL